METVTPTLPAELSPILAGSHLGETPLAWVPAQEVPQPYHQLLVHDHDMTSELAGFHRDSIALRVIRSKRTGRQYLREVTLHAASTGTTVEYGIIEILLDAFPARLHDSILAGDTPLGAILNSSGLQYRSNPQGFFTVPASSLGPIFSQSAGGEVLYGRYNHLICNQDTCLARILEILPH
jgi:chorismate-pyruvate lyase